MLFSTYLNAEEFKLNENNNNTELNFYTGMFDFSDDGKRAGLVGLEHQNVNLKRLENVR